MGYVNGQMRSTITVTLQYIRCKNKKSYNEGKNRDLYHELLQSYTMEVARCIKRRNSCCFTLNSQNKTSALLLGQNHEMYRIMRCISCIFLLLSYKISFGHSNTFAKERVNLVRYLLLCVAITCKCTCHQKRFYPSYSSINYNIIANIKLWFIIVFFCLSILNIPKQHRNVEEIFRKYSIEILQYCKNIYKVVRKVSEILQEPCNVHSKHYKWNVAAILIFRCNIAIM